MEDKFAEALNIAAELVAAESDSKRRERNQRFRLENRTVEQEPGKNYELANKVNYHKCTVILCTMTSVSGD